MSISRWDPWSDFFSVRDAMDRMLSETMARPRELGMGGAFSVPIDVQEDESAFTVKATLPGVKPEDIDLQINDDTLRITGEVKEEHEEQKKGQWLTRERRFGRFQRSVTLPMRVQAEQADADFENGVLTVRLPKSPEARPRSIPVRGGQGQQQIEAQSKTKTT